MRSKCGCLCLLLVVACQREAATESPPAAPVVAPAARPQEEPAVTDPAEETEAVPVDAPDDGAPDLAQLFAPGAREKADTHARDTPASTPSVEGKARLANDRGEDGAAAKPRPRAARSKKAPAPAKAPAADRASEMAAPVAAGSAAPRPAGNGGSLNALGAGSSSRANRGAPGDLGRGAGGLHRPYPLPVVRPPYPLPVVRPQLIARRPPRRRIVRATRPFRPLPAMPTAWPRDARYRANYLPGRGYLEHLRSSLKAEKKLGAGAEGTLDLPTAMSTSWPAPTERALTMVIDQTHGRLPPAGGETTLRVRVRAADRAPKPRAPLRVHLVIDGSGSMKGAPWRSVCAAARDVAARLTPNDRLSVTLYDTKARQLSPAVPGGRAVDDLATRICRLRPTGNTNIYEGLVTGYQQARAAYDPRAINRVILLSDGIATAGPRDLHTITTGTVEAVGFGVTTSVVGVGDEFDALLMGRIASEGAGNYHFARDHRAVVSVFSDELAVLAQEAAQAVEVRVALHPQVELLEVVGSQPLGVVDAARARQVERATDERLAQDRGIATDRQLDRDEGIRFLMPSFRLGDEHTFLIRVRVPTRGEDNTLTLAHASLRYKDMLFDRNQHVAARRIAAYAADDREAEASRKSELEIGEAQARVAHALERASQYLHRRNVGAIRRELYSAASRLTGAAERAGSAAIAEEARRVQKLADLAGLANTPKQMNVLAGVYHYGWRAHALSLAR